MTEQEHKEIVSRVKRADEIVDRIAELHTIVKLLQESSPYGVNLRGFASSTWELTIDRSAVAEMLQKKIKSLQAEYKAL